MPTTPRRSRSRTRSTSSPAAARNGRSNFTPYYQLSVWSDRTCAFAAGKGSHWSPEEARATAKPGTRARLVRVAPEGRTILEEFTA